MLYDKYFAFQMDRSGYRLRDNKLPFAVGTDCSNPWLLNTQRRARSHVRVFCLPWFKVFA